MDFQWKLSKSIFVKCGEDDCTKTEELVIGKVLQNFTGQGEERRLSTCTSDNRVRDSDFLWN